MQRIYFSIKPVPHFTISADDAARTLTLTVEEGSAKPYLYNGKAYHRAGSSTVEVGRIEYARLALKGTSMTFDALESRSHDLNFKQLSKELSDKLALRCVDENSLKSLELMSADGVFNNAAALQADRNDFPGTDVVRFGTGIPRIIQEYVDLNVSPCFEVREASITVILPVESRIELDDGEKAVLAALPKGQKLSRAQIAEAASMSKDKAIRLLNRLVEKRLVAQTGAGRAVR